MNHKLVDAEKGRSIVWVVLDLLISKGIPFLLTFLFARKLGPDIFSDYGIVVIFLSIASTLLESGLLSAVIKEQQISNEQLNSLFFLNLLCSLALFIVSFVVGFVYSRYSANVQLFNLIICSSALFVINAFGAVQLALLYKYFYFKRVFTLNVMAWSIGVLVSIILLNKGFALVGLVLAYLGAQIFFVIGLWLTSDWKPTFRIAYNEVSDHFRYGLKLMFSGLLDNIFKYAYNFLLMGFYPAGVLAFYERSRSMQDYPTMAISSVINRHSFPVLAKANEESVDRFNLVTRHYFKLAGLINTAIMGLLFACAPVLFELVLGKQWLDAVPYLQVLCVIGLLYPHHAFNLNILKVFGRADLFLRLEIIKKLLLVLSMFLFYKQGLTALLWVMFINSLLTLGLNIYFNKAYTTCGFYHQFKDLALSIAVSIPAIWLSINFVTHAGEWHLFFQLLLQILIFLLSYAGLSVCLYKKEIVHAFQLFTKI